MRIERKNLNKNLPKKGFVKETGTHHIYFHHQIDGIATGISTYLSHSKKTRDYSGNLLTSVRKQLELDSNQEVADLVNCPMSEADYLEILSTKGFI